MDTLTPADRHKNMSHIRSKNTKPEKQIRSVLHRAGFRYRICDKRYPGKPDLIFPHYYAVIFVNGCFWHAHGWGPSRSSITSTHANDAIAAYAHGWDPSRSSIISTHANDANASYAHENCRYFVFPKSNQEFWKKKFSRNKERDAEILKYYRDQCWRVCFVWECAIRGKNSNQKIENVTDQIIRWLDDSEEPYLEIRG